MLSERVRFAFTFEGTPTTSTYLSTNLDTTSKTFRRNIRAFNNFLVVDCVKVDLVFHGPGTSTFNPTMTVHGQIYYYLEAMVSPPSRRASFLFVYIHHTDFVRQGDLRAAYMPSYTLQYCNYSSQCFMSAISLLGRVRFFKTWLRLSMLQVRRAQSFTAISVPHPSTFADIMAYQLRILWQSFQAQMTVYPKDKTFWSGSAESSMQIASSSLILFQ